MARPRSRTDLDDSDIAAVYTRHKSLAKASAELGMSARTLQRNLHRMGMKLQRGRRPFLPATTVDNLVIARAGAKSLPDLREEAIVLRDIEGNAVPSKALGAYTILVSRDDPDRIKLRGTLVNGSEVEIVTTITAVKESLNA